MSSFYQSPLRTHILRDIYKRSTFDVEFLGRKYMGQMKEKSKLGMAARRYMMHGIELNDYTHYSDELAEGLKRLTRDFGKHRGDMMFQLGVVNAFESKAVNDYKIPETVTQARQSKQNRQNNYKTRYNLQPTIREHMPEATVVLDLSIEDTARQKDYSESGRRYINKGKRAELSFAIATTQEERDVFYQTRYTTAFDKGFGVIKKEEFEALRDFLMTEKKGRLFLAKKGQDIVSGSICLCDCKEIIYLYGATDRSFGDIGGHYRLTDQISSRGHEQGFQTFDLLGIAPIGYPEHHLAGVSRFKQAFGGQVISYLGNFDYVFNSWLYKGFSLSKKM